MGWGQKRERDREKKERNKEIRYKEKPGKLDNGGEIDR